MWNKRKNKSIIVIVVVIMKDCLCHEGLQTIWQVVPQKLHQSRSQNQSQIHWPMAGKVFDRAGRRTNDQCRRARPPTPLLPVAHLHHRCAAEACAAGTNVVF
jgi:hypothetical protein